jgi:hypothetical protein
MSILELIFVFSVFGFYIYLLYLNIKQKLYKREKQK